MDQITQFIVNLVPGNAMSITTQYEIAIAAVSELLFLGKS